MENEALLSGKALPIILIGGGKLQPIRDRILAIIEHWSAVISSAEVWKRMAVVYFLQIDSQREIVK